MIKLQNLFANHLFHFVIPAQAGIYFELNLANPVKSWVRRWIPACARMTG